MATTESAGPFVGGGCRSSDDGDGLEVSLDDCIGYPTSWSLLEVGSSGGGSLSYGGGGVSSFGSDFTFDGLGNSFTPPPYYYTGYLVLRVGCSDGSTQDVDSWTTIEGGPTRSFNHTYSNPCCPQANANNSNTILAGGRIIIPGVSNLGIATRVLNEFKKLNPGLYNTLREGMTKTGAVFNGDRLTSIGTKFYDPGSVGSANTATNKAIIETLKKAIEAAGAALQEKAKNPTLPIIPFVIPLPLLPGWNPATGRFDDGWQGACNDPGTLNPGVGSAILASSNGRPSINLGDIYGPSMAPSLVSNNHVITAFGGSPPTTFPTALVSRG
jgi:hypothetical protein